MANPGKDASIWTPQLPRGLAPLPPQLHLPFPPGSTTPSLCNPAAMPAPGTHLCNVAFPQCHNSQRQEITNYPQACDPAPVPWATIFFSTPLVTVPQKNFHILQLPLPLENPFGPKLATTKSRHQRLGKPETVAEKCKHWACRRRSIVKKRALAAIG